MSVQRGNQLVEIGDQFGVWLLLIAAQFGVCVVVTVVQLTTTRS
jgi:hypothetical protein